MPGGTRAILEPWRSLFAQLQSHTDFTALARRHADLPVFQRLAGKPLATLERMINKGFNTPMTSSCGRLFDAFAAAVGFSAESISYEGQAAIELENCLDDGMLDTGDAYPFALDNAALTEIDPAPMWLRLFDDLAAGLPRAEIAARFHRGLAVALIDCTAALATHEGIGHVALCGGVFQNRSLLRLCRDGLEAKNLTVLQHRQVPANDGGLSLGQAAVAAARINHGG